MRPEVISEQHGTTWFLELYSLDYRGLNDRTAVNLLMGNAKTVSPAEQVFGGASGAVIVGLTYMLEFRSGEPNWIVRSIAQDVIVAGLEIAIPWLATFLLAILAGIFGMRTYRLQEKAQALIATGFGLLPVGFLCFAFWGLAH